MDKCCFERENLEDGDDNNIVCKKCGTSRRLYK